MVLHRPVELARLTGHVENVSQFDSEARHGPNVYPFDSEWLAAA